MLRPDDIRSTAFKKGLFGYKAADVDSFKDTVFRAYSDLSKDYEETKDKFDKLTKAMEDTRLKLFELENKLQQAENVSTDAGESVEAKKRADQIIKNAEATAADIIAKAKAQSESLRAPQSQRQKHQRLSQNQRKSLHHPSSSRKQTRMYIPLQQATMMTMRSLLGKSKMQENQIA